MLGFNKEQIEELKKENYDAPMIFNSESIRVKILHRGEYLFFFEKLKDRAVIIEIDIINSIVYEKSIIKWDNGQLISSIEFKEILNCLKFYFKNYQKKELKFS